MDQIKIEILADARAVFEHRLPGLISVGQNGCVHVEAAEDHPRRSFGRSFVAASSTCAS